MKKIIIAAIAFATLFNAGFAHAQYYNNDYDYQQDQLDSIRRSQEAQQEWSNNLQQQNFRDNCYNNGGGYRCGQY